MMPKTFKILFLLVFSLSIGGCGGYRAYLGMHGNSIRLHPEVHEVSLSEDGQCLECHHPDHAAGPPSPHPGFKGCLKCHNDEIAAASKQN